MQRTVNAQAARQRLGELLEGVFYRDDVVVIERAGKPMGVVISPRRYAEIERQRAVAFARIGQAIDEIRAANAGADPDEVERVVEQAVQEVRQERRERRARSDTAERDPVEVAEPAPVPA